MCLLWLLMAAALHVLGDKRRDAQWVRCSNNLKVLMAAREMYAVDHQNPPLALTWPPSGPQSTRLQVHAELNTGSNPTGQKVSDEELSTVPIVREEFHGDWNYKILPEPRKLRLNDHFVS